MLREGIRALSFARFSSRRKRLSGYAMLRVSLLPGLCISFKRSKFKPGVVREKGTVTMDGRFWIPYQLSTFPTDAANQAGISRRYGGIHFKAADLTGRAIGRIVGYELSRPLQM